MANHFIGDNRRVSFNEVRNAIVSVQNRMLDTIQAADKIFGKEAALTKELRSLRDHLNGIVYELDDRAK